MSLDQVLTVAEMKALARRRVPKMFFDYAASGSWSESTMRANEDDFERVLLNQRVAVNMEGRSLASTMMGQDVAMPIALAPTGLTGMQWPDGEIRAAQAAEAFGVPFTLSTMSVCSIEDVAENTSAPFWFQLYVMRDRQFIERLIDRAKAAGCPVLVLTMDLQILGQRHADVRNGLSVPPQFKPSHIWQVGTRPGWALRMLTTRRYAFGNIAGHVDANVDLRSLAKWTSEQFDPKLNWDDLKWIKDRFGGPVIVKGVLDRRDAIAAVDHGADGVIVSNHGGRQLDGAPSSIAVLPEIVDAIGERAEIYLDGGVYSGQALIKAMALGAKGGFIGRAFLWGLGAGGQRGVVRVLEILHREADITMALCGERKVTDVGQHNVFRNDLLQRQE